MSRILGVLRKDMVDVGDESSLGFPSLLVEFVERPLAFRLSLPAELCRKAIIHQLEVDLDNPGPGLGFSTLEGELNTY